MVESCIDIVASDKDLHANNGCLIAHAMVHIFQNFLSFLLYIIIEDNYLYSPFAMMMQGIFGRCLSSYIWAHLNSVAVRSQGTSESSKYTWLHVTHLMLRLAQSLFVESCQLCYIIHLSVYIDHVNCQTVTL